MAIKRWGDAEKALVQEYLGQGKNDAEIVELLQAAGIRRTYKAVQRLRQRQGWTAQIAQSPHKWEGPITIEGDIVILADAHIPFHDAEWMNRVIALAVKWGVKKVGVPGDWIDLNALCYFGRRKGVELDDELGAARRNLSALAATFDEIALCGGNHERRYARMLGYAKSMQAVLQEFVTSPKVMLTSNYWFYAKSGGETFRITHPANYSRNATYTAKRMASKYRCHIIAGHNHLWGIARDDSDTWWAVDTGMCADLGRLSYVEEEMSTFPKQMQGATIIKNGIPYLLCPANIAGYEQM